MPGLPSSVFVCVVFVRVIVRVFVRMIVHARVLVSLNRFLIALPRMQLYKVNRFASAGRGCMNRCARTRRRATEPRYREDDRVMRLQPTATCALAPDHPSVRGKSQPCRPLPSGRTPARPGGRRPSSRLRRRGAVVARGSHVPRRGRERGRGAWACLLLPPLPSLHLRASLPCSRIIFCSTSRHPAAAVRFTGNAPSPWEAYVACVLRPLSRPRGDSICAPACLCLPGHCPRLCPRLCTAIACTPVSTPAPFASAPAFSGTGPAPCGSASPGPRPSPARPPAASSAMELSDSRRQESARGAGGPLLRRRARLPRQAEESVRDNVAPRPPPATRAAAWRARSRRPPKRPPQGDLGHVESATIAIEGVTT